MKTKFLLNNILFKTIILSALTLNVDAQTVTDDLQNLLSTDSKSKELTYGTFKTTRIINGHSIENTGTGVLDFRISHHFAAVNGGIKEFFGLDGANMRLGFDYGVNDRITVGIGRSSLFKEYDGYVKAKILQQTTKDEMPLSLSYIGGMSVSSMSSDKLLGRPLVAPETYPFSNRLFYFNQLLIARKINDNFSIQLMPTHIHYNLVSKSIEKNDLFSLGLGGRIKLNRRTSFNFEYYYQFNRLQNTINSLSLGFDVETGGHVFQLYFTNGAGMTERTFITQSKESWLDGGFRFGFTISRVFTIIQPKGFEGTNNHTW